MAERNRCGRRTTPPEPCSISVPREGAGDLDHLPVDSNGDPTEVRVVGGQQVIVHYVDIPEKDTTVVDGIPCTTPLRTVIDLAPDLDPVELERIIDYFLGRGSITTGEAFARLAEDDMQLRPGAPLVREVLSNR